MAIIPTEPGPGPNPVPDLPPIGEPSPPIKEPEPDHLPDEEPNPNPDENDHPPKQTGLRCPRKLFAPRRMKQVGEARLSWELDGVAGDLRQVKTPA